MIKIFSYIKWYLFSVWAFASPLAPADREGLLLQSWLQWRRVWSLWCPLVFNSSIGTVDFALNGNECKISSSKHNIETHFPKLYSKRCKDDCWYKFEGKKNALFTNGMNASCEAIHPWYNLWWRLRRRYRWGPASIAPPHRHCMPRFWLPAESVAEQQTRIVF